MHLIDKQLKVLGLKVRTARTKRGYKTQKDFARHMTGNPKSSATIVSRVETGKDLDYKKFLLIARKLELPLSYFFDSEEKVITESYKDQLSLKAREEYELIRIGNIIADKRKAMGKTLLDFESGIGVAGIDSSNLSKIERGKSNFRFSLLIRICKELDLELSDLFEK